MCSVWKSALLPHLFELRSTSLGFCVFRSTRYTLSRNFASSGVTEHPGVAPSSIASLAAPKASPSFNCLSQEDVEDSVMGLLSRYAANPVKDLQLDTVFDELEASTGHEVPNTAFFGEAATASKAVATERRVWDALDTSELFLDVETLLHIHLPDSVADTAKTPKDLVNAVVDQLRHAGRYMEHPEANVSTELTAGASDAPAETLQSLRK